MIAGIGIPGFAGPFLGQVLLAVAAWRGRLPESRARGRRGAGLIKARPRVPNADGA